MCFITTKKPRKVRLDKNGEGVGYKVFPVDSHGNLVGEYASKRKIRPHSEWIHEKDYRPTAHEKLNMGGEKIYGWRVFTGKRGAQKWNASFSSPLPVRKIKFRKVKSVGYCCDFGRAILAEEIFIPKEKQ